MRRLRLAYHALRGRPILHRVDVAGGIVTLPAGHCVVSSCTFTGTTVVDPTGRSVPLPVGPKWQTLR